MEEMHQMASKCGVCMRGAVCSGAKVRFFGKSVTGSLMLVIKNQYNHESHMIACS